MRRVDIWGVPPRTQARLTGTLHDAVHLGQRDIKVYVPRHPSLMLSLRDPGAPEGLYWVIRFRARYYSAADTISVGPLYAEDHMALAEVEAHLVEKELFHGKEVEEVEESEQPAGNAVPQRPGAQERHGAQD